MTLLPAGMKRLAQRGVDRAFLRMFDGSRMVGPEFPGNIGGRRVMLRSIWVQKVLGFNRKAPVPVAPSTHVSNWRNLDIPKDRGLDNLRSPGCYFQNIGAVISWGRGVYIGPNVGIITTNHDETDLDRHVPGRPVHIGDFSWIGMNAVLLPGVTIGPRTIVGAGAVVTRSFPEGHCVLVGNPARPVRSLNTEE